MNPDDVRKAVELFADFLSQYFIALAAVGALAMAVIEFWKKLRDSRTRYHARQVTEWFCGAEGTQAFDERMPATHHRLDAYADLLHLTTGAPFARASETSDRLRTKDGRVPNASWRPWTRRDQEYAVFGLDLEAMMGRVQTAADTAFSSPDLYGRLFAFMTDGANPGDVKRWLDMVKDTPKELTADQAKERAEVYARLHTLAKRKIDAFQLFTGMMWANKNQREANIVGALVMGAALWWAQTHPGGVSLGRPLQADEIAGIVVLALLGGALSPIAKDLVSALNRVRDVG